MKVFKQITKKDLVVGETYFLNSNGENEMYFIGFDDDEESPMFYPIGGKTPYFQSTDGTVLFSNPMIWDEYEEV
jgi:hypothetical protein